MLVPLGEMGEAVSIHLSSKNGLHVKVKNERFTAAGSACRQNLKFENGTSSFGRLRHRNGLICVQQVQHDYFSSFNQ